MDEDTEYASSYLLQAERLPLFARIALTRIEDEPGQRSIVNLRALLASLANIYGDSANRRIVLSCIWICHERYGQAKFPIRKDETGAQVVCWPEED